MSEKFLETYNGTLYGVLKWEKLGELWSSILKQDYSGWFIYAPGHDVPEKIADNDELDQFISRMDKLLREEHDEDYCGIVYTDNFEQPTLVKIFDPNNLGTSCGSSNTTLDPGWIISKEKPEPIKAEGTIPGNRKRWWNKLWS